MSRRIEAFNTCENCGAVYGRRRRPSGKLELMSAFQPRRFCSPQCRATRTGAERKIPFWDRVDRSGGPDACWPWTGARNTFGYGNVGENGFTLTASRVAYELTYGFIPPGEGYHGNVVRHTCDNPPCCNPRHLVLGTQADNNHDRDVRRRLYAADGQALSKIARFG